MWEKFLSKEEGESILRTLERKLSLLGDLNLYSLFFWFEHKFNSEGLTEADVRYIHDYLGSYENI